MLELLHQSQTEGWNYSLNCAISGDLVVLDTTTDNEFREDYRIFNWKTGEMVLVRHFMAVSCVSWYSCTYKYHLIQ